MKGDIFRLEGSITFLSLHCQSLTGLIAYDCQNEKYIIKFFSPFRNIDWLEKIGEHFDYTYQGI